MGIVLWLVSSAAAFGIARMAPYRRPAGRRIGELVVSVLAGLGSGVIATARDFGGWNEPDWRAGVFCFLGALIGAGLFRLFTSASRRASAVHEPL